MSRKVLRRFIINMAILTFVMFTVWALVRSLFPGGIWPELTRIQSSLDPWSYGMTTSPLFDPVMMFSYELRFNPAEFP